MHEWIKKHSGHLITLVPFGSSAGNYIDGHCEDCKEKDVWVIG